MKITNKSGFSVVAILTIIVAILVIGALGYTAYNQFMVSDELAEQTVIAEDIDTIESTVPESVDNASDIDKAIEALNQITETESANDTDLITEQLVDL